MTCEYFYANNDSIQKQIEQIFSQLPKTADNRILRLVLFGRVTDNDTYVNNVQVVAQAIDQHFGICAPVWSYVAQEPMGAQLAAEVWSIEAESVKVEYKALERCKYIVTNDNGVKSLHCSVSETNILRPTTEQSNSIFEQIGRILSAENMPVNSIVRQWNYIEHITDYQSDIQNYQAFNDARSLFYAQASWSSGYPAATGIGTDAGGVIVDFCATTDRRIITVDNKLQIGAHKYSNNVLIGNTQMATTPKFERAKIVNDVLYISGTAAIRGENSVSEHFIVTQTSITIENIDELLRTANFNEVIALRVYLKDSASYYIASVLVNEHFPMSKTLYVKADICRKELLIEIEGIAI